MLARLFGSSLDHRLAAGHLPESSRPLAARARLIVSTPWRETLAADWEHLLKRLSLPGPPRRGRLGVAAARRSAVVAAAPEIRRLAGALRTPLPVPARGVAIASILLTNGVGPLYNPRSPVAVADAVTQAVASLDPAQPLMPS